MSDLAVIFPGGRQEFFIGKADFIIWLGEHPSDFARFVGEENGGHRKLPRVVSGAFNEMLLVPCRRLLIQLEGNAHGLGHIEFAVGVNRNVHLRFFLGLGDIPVCRG